MQFFDLLVTRQRPRIGNDRFYLDAVGFQHVEHVSIAGLAPLFPPIADHENDFPPGAVAPAQVKSCPQNRVVEYMRFFRRGVNRRWPLNYPRESRSPWVVPATRATSQNRRPVGAPAHQRFI